jgi:hypothetical protein
MPKSRVLLIVVSVRSATLFVILLDSRVLVVDMKGRDHPLGDDSGAKAAGRGLVHAAVENQLHLVGSSDVQIFANHLFEEDPVSSII